MITLTDFLFAVRISLSIIFVVFSVVFVVLFIRNCILGK